jgi:sterol desaturase/sphingolipid hydroxylase (fatty acid hydroxylase superfamily)
LYHDWVSNDLRQFIWPLFSNPGLYLVAPFLWLLEYLFPVRPRQPLIGKALLQDVVWLALRLPTDVLFVNGAIHLVRDFYETHLAFLTVRSLMDWPGYLQVVASLLIGEFFFWLSHFVRHKIHSFWVFHAVHHSQQELNMATEDRNHFADRLISNLLMIVPLLIFQVGNLKTVGLIVLYRSIHNRFIHSNIKLNLGWLGWILASPQFHRVHHSMEPAHVDKNFGGLFSFFDYLFGTAYPSRDVYPDTGIADERFSNETQGREGRLLTNWVRQTIYPFADLGGRTLLPPLEARLCRRPLTPTPVVESIATVALFPTRRDPDGAIAGRTRPASGNPSVVAIAPTPVAVHPDHAGAGCRRAEFDSNGRRGSGGVVVSSGRTTG